MSTRPESRPGPVTSPTGGTAVLEARELWRSLPLGGQVLDILRGISFRIDRGEFVALMGPSGSGKSTLLGCISGLDQPSRGQVLLNGIDITRMKESQLADIRNRAVGMVFQAYNLIPTLTAQENVEVPLYVGDHPGSPALRAQELLTLVGLGQRFGHRPAQLSGGEQQRVAVARALATAPPLVIADEPTGNIDGRQGAALLDLLEELRQRTGTTFVIATHDEAVGGRADRVLRIADGVLVADERRDGRPRPVELAPPPA